jgi:hypothetical protein
MPSFKEELARMLWLQHEGKIADDEPTKVIFPRRAAKERVENKKERTRLIRELDTHVTYSEFNAEFDRYIEHSGGNPQIAYSLMLRCLAQLSDESIKKLAEDEA